MGAKPGELYSVTPHKMTEKPKIYMGGGMRVNKDDIDVLTTSHGRRMYRLSDDPEPYISAMIEFCMNEVKKLENRVRMAKAMLNKWEEE